MILSDEQCDEILAICHQAELTKAQVHMKGEAAGTEVDRIRISNVASIYPQFMPEWLNQLVPDMFKGWGASWTHMLPYQYSEYEVGGHYDWHIDHFEVRMPEEIGERVITAIIQLNGPEEYDGGEIQIKDMQVDRLRGLVTVHGMYDKHRVLPVTRGVRKSLVVWPMKVRKNTKKWDAEDEEKLKTAHGTKMSWQYEYGLHQKMEKRPRVGHISYIPQK